MNIKMLNKTFCLPLYGLNVSWSSSMLSNIYFQLTGFPSSGGKRMGRIWTQV